MTLSKFTKNQLIEEARQAVIGCKNILRVSPNSDAHHIGLRLAEITLEALTAPPAPLVPPVPENLANAFIAAIEKEQDRLHDEDYLMDSRDCIDVIREELQRLNDCRAAMHGVTISNSADIAIDEASQSLGNSEQLEPASQTYTLRDGLEAIRKLGPIDTGKIQAERDALNEPTCWCLTCRPVTMTDMRFVVCPDCGNKRCPKANDHSNACSGSNEPGQEGSAYPAAPKQESE